MERTITAIDEAWYPRIVPNNAQVNRRLKAAEHRENKRMFLAGGSYAGISYPHLIDSGREEKLANLATLANDLSQDTKLPKGVRNVYLERVEEKMRMIELVKAAATAQEPTVEGERATDRFHELTARIYGAPKAPVFAQLLEQLAIEFGALPIEAHRLPAFERFTALIDARVSHDIEPFVPIPAPQDEGSYITDAKEVVARITARLEVLELKEWSATISKAAVGGFMVAPQRRRIIVPKSSVLRNRKPERKLTESRLEAIIAHEVLTHAVRAEHGRHSSLRLLGDGLAGYIHGEEGIATYRQQCIMGARDYASESLYLAIALAWGVDRGGQRRSFRETFESIRDFYTLRYYGQSQDVDERAYTLCDQVYIATTVPDRDLVLTRDIAYREGNIAIHQLLRHQPERAQWFDLGKFDPTNENHVGVMRAAGVIKD